MMFLPTWRKLIYAQLRRNNEKSASINENLRKENRELKRKAYPERYVLPSFINVEATRIYKDKQGQCHIAMKFTGGSKEYSEKMSNEDFMAFRNGDLTKEEVIAKYHKHLIEGYIRREFSRTEKRSAALSLIENTIFGYIKLYASSTFVPSSNGDNNPRKRRNYDDIDDMNDEERKGMAYKWIQMAIILLDNSLKALNIQKSPTLCPSTLSCKRKFFVLEVL